jgi:lipopolysaccharide biosynthesis glycosyltransferase
MQIPVAFPTISIAKGFSSSTTEPFNREVYLIILNKMRMNQLFRNLFNFIRRKESELAKNNITKLRG